MKRLRPLTAWIMAAGVALLVATGVFRWLAAGPRPAAGPPPEPARIHLNHAGARELCQIAGMNLTVAEEVVRYRSRHGRIKSYDELLSIRGVGPARLRQLQADTDLDEENH